MRVSPGKTGQFSRLLAVWTQWVALGCSKLSLPHLADQDGSPRAVLLDLGVGTRGLGNVHLFHGADDRAGQFTVEFAGQRRVRP